jgi:hypothetical protein
MKRLLVITLLLAATTLSAQHTLDTKSAANPNGVTSTTLSSKKLPGYGCLVFTPVYE